MEPIVLKLLWLTGHAAFGFGIYIVALFTLGLRDVSIAGGLAAFFGSMMIGVIAFAASFMFW